MMRSIVLGALCVWSVAKTRWPVSAAVSAVAIVSRSRISPRRITSGSWRSAPRSASAKPIASWPTSRWLTMQRLWWWRNSIGSSIVMMWSVRVRLISSISEASVVDLPEPVGPVTSTRPRGFVVNSWSDAGQPELLERLDVGRDRAEGRREALALVVGVDAEAGEPANAVGEVELAVDLEVLLLLGRRDPVDELADEVRVELREVVRAARCARAGGRPAASRPSGAGRTRRARRPSRAARRRRAGHGSVGDARRVPRWPSIGRSPPAP